MKETVILIGFIQSVFGCPYFYIKTAKALKFYLFKLLAIDKCIVSGQSIVTFSGSGLF